jgi:predicted patatin/cPLA2 family phospholipase
MKSTNINSFFLFINYLIIYNSNTIQQSMNKALILNSGAFWAAYQIGALKKLVEEDKLHFDLCAGTGIGAMNAAFIACGEWEALNTFWNNIKPRKLMSINWKSPFKKGFFTGKPQQKFIDKHVSEEKLKARGTTLVFSCLNLNSGKEELFTYPGENRLSLSDAIMAAVAVPGMSKYGELENNALVEGTFVRSFILHRIFKDYRPKQMYAVAAYAQGKNQVVNPKEYNTWMRQLKRTFQLNMCRDVDAEITKTERDIKAMQEYKLNIEQMGNLIGLHVDDKDFERVLVETLEEHQIKSHFTHTTGEIPSLIKIVSGKEIEFPLWSSKKSKLNNLQREGYSDACKVLAT